MSVDLEERLTRYADTLDRAIAADLNTDVVELSPPPAPRRWTPVIVVAAASLSAVVLGFALRIERQPSIRSNESNPDLSTAPGPSPIDSPESIAIPQSDDDTPPSPWDPIRVAPGTIGWFEAGDGLPAELAAAPETDVPGTVIDVPSTSADYLSNFFRCVDWTTDLDGPICTRLGGGNGIEHVDYGDRLGVGVALGATDPVRVASNLADGSLWSYDDDTEHPAPTGVPIGSTTGALLRNGDHAYLVWKYQPGVIVWLHARGLTDDQLVTVASGVHPVSLPDRLPVLLQITPPAEGTLNNPLVDEDGGLKMGWLDGVPCVGLNMWETCTPIDEPAVVARAIWGDGITDQLAAIAPTGTATSVRVELYGTRPNTIPLRPTDFGIDVGVVDAGKERITAAQITAGDGTVLARYDAPDDPSSEDTSGGGPVFAEGRTSEIAWVIRRQDPNDPNLTAWYGPGRSARYCLLLEGPGEFAPLCPPRRPPSTGLGQQALYHETLNLVELGADVATVTCGGVRMPIITDNQLDNRRFAVISCVQPETSP